MNAGCIHPHIEDRAMPYLYKIYNGLRLGEGGGFDHKCSYEALLFGLAQMFLRSTEPPLLPNLC